VNQHTKYNNNVEQSEYYELSQRILVLEERMNTHHAKYESAIDRLRADMATRETQMETSMAKLETQIAKRETQMAKRDLWLILTVTALTISIVGLIVSVVLMPQ